MRACVSSFRIAGSRLVRSHLLRAACAALFLCDTESAAQERLEKIVGGREVETGQWPAVVAITAGDELCTGTTVAPDLILTAAHCFRTAREGEPVTIHFGERINSRVVESAEWTTHPDFCGEPSCSDIGHDFAYVRVPSAAEQLNSYIRPLHDPANWGEIPLNPRVTLVGFGHFSPEALGAGGGVKREVVVAAEAIDSVWNSFVAGGNGADSCLGDSGGPALIEFEHEWRLLGVLSRGRLPCTEGGTYESGALAAQWLKETVVYDPDDYAPNVNAEALPEIEYTTREMSCSHRHGLGKLGLPLLTLAVVAFARRFSIAR